MGLDMYLYEKSTDEEIGYWRKHPNLHGFIVKEFANGVDECQEIPLTKDDVKKIIEATEKDLLPHTTGFFFGVSRPEDKIHTLKVFREVLEEMEEYPNYEIYYQASW